MSQQKSHTKTATKVTDLEPVLKQWAWEQYNRTVWWFSRISRENAVIEVNWSKVKVKTKDTVFPKEDFQETTQSQVLFESKYENNTDYDQTNTFSTEKETTSSAVMKLTQGFSKSTVVGIDIPLPPKETLTHPSKAVASFGTCLHIESEEENKVEKKLKWSVDTTITSKGHKLTVAKLEVEETQVDYNFSVDVELKGRVIINIRDSRNMSKVLQTLQNDIAVILYDLHHVRDRRFNDVTKHLTFNLNNGTATWPFAGSVTLNYGISQKVNLSDQSLPEMMSSKRIQTEKSYIKQSLLKKGRHY